jgi:hypothetical protein
MAAPTRARLRVLPHEELYLLRNAIEAALLHASSGQCAEGYHELTYGLRRAEMMCRDGIPWAQELEARYQRALRGFRSRFESLAL